MYQKPKDNNNNNNNNNKNIRNEKKKEEVNIVMKNWITLKEIHVLFAYLLNESILSILTNCCVFYPSCLQFDIFFVFLTTKREKKKRKICSKYSNPYGNRKHNEKFQRIDGKMLKMVLRYSVDFRTYGKVLVELRNL